MDCAPPRPEHVIDAAWLAVAAAAAHAPSDGPNMMPLDQLDPLILRCVEMWELARK